MFRHTPFPGDSHRQVQGVLSLWLRLFFIFLPKQREKIAFSFHSSVGMKVRLRRDLCVAQDVPQWLLIPITQK